ncbi:hypothetical protein [Amycolatopsis sp. cmx-4-68]|uniref:hypothetical protein n=1 Tax=Amycolatopsis sp. cmx-4-68 TaxID=2790938 RepID=UPI00397B0128
MPEDPAEDRKQLADRMERERIRRDLGNWDDVARKMGVSSALLRRLRNGTAPITYKNEVKIERFYGWPEGEVRRLVSQAADPTDEQIAEMSARELAAHALHVEKTRGIEARKRWLKHAYSVWWDALGADATDSAERQPQSDHLDA